MNRRLLTRKEVCAVLGIHYSTLNRMMNASEFISSVNGRKRKLLFDPDAVEAWIKARQQPVTPAVIGPKPPQEMDRKRRLELAYAALEKHKPSKKGGRND